jgi:outer membrane receptor protein involved in Fe transport
MRISINKKICGGILKLFNMLVLVILIQSTSTMFAQGKGSVSGKVIDKSTGEALIGVNVLLKGTNHGSATDIEGKYLISSIEPGNYELIVSMVSYANTQIPNVIIKVNENTKVNITLQPEAISVGEVIVESKADNSYEAALLNKQKDAMSISDGISSEQVRRSPDVTSSDALKRISGVSIVDNKYAFVRGTSERYSNAMLNNSILPSTEPDKKSFAFDLLPSNLLDNTIITKSFTPDKPGDFSGGLIQLNTIDFPDRLKVNFSLNASYLGNTSFKNYSTYSGGKLDYLGIDDGTRSIPDNIPTNLNKGNYTPDQMLRFATSFKNNWATKNSKAPINSGFSFSIGDGTSLFGPHFGFIAALSYRNNYTNTNIERNEYESDNSKRFSYSGLQSKFSTLWGGLLNLSYKIGGANKISFKNTYSRTSDDEVAELKGSQFTDSGTDQIQSAMRFTERYVLSSQLIGEHFFSSLNNLQVEWLINNSSSKRSEPDYRRITYAKPIGQDVPYSAVLGFQVNLKNGGRFFSDLNETAKSVGTNFTLPIGSIKIKFGGLFDTKHRDFSSRLFGMIINAPGNGFTDFRLLYLPKEEIFAQENFRKNGFSVQEYLNGTNNYKADEKIASGYLMADIPITIAGSELRIITGARIENSDQTIKSRDLSDQKDIFIQLKKTDILPSINLIYKLNSVTNIRAAFSQTINRPELRELAPFAYFDFYTQTSIRGNENLKRALIKNYDLRIETYPNIGEMVSASFFYKNILDAIEQVVVTGSALGSERTFLNSKSANVYGFELEVKIFLENYIKTLEGLSVVGNYSWIKSKVDVEGSETTIARKNRPLQGQSPYVINLGLNYSSSSMGTIISLLYNRIGERIVEVATAYEEDILEMPRDVIDITITQPVLDNFEIKFAIKDLLAKAQKFNQGSHLSRLNSKDRSISFGISYKL